MNLVQIGYSGYPTQRFWIDSSGGVVTLVSGDCQQLPITTLQPPDQCNASSTSTDGHSRAFVAIRYGNLTVVYAHLQPSLRIGALNKPIIKNQLLGKTAPNDEGPHLHFEGRTYGQSPFNQNQVPLIFVNSWQYFDPATQTTINQNIQNRFNDDSQAVRGYNGQFDGGTQRTQCFRSPVNPPAGAPSNATTGIQVYGYDAQGNPNYTAFEWRDSSGNNQVFAQPPLATTWQQVCIP